MGKGSSSSHPRRGRKPLRRRRRLPDKLIVPPEAETFVVEPSEAGMRLDRFLKRKLKWRSREKVQELIRGREVTADGARVDQAYHVKRGQEIRMPLPPAPDAADRIAEIPLDILYEDDLLVILNKQPDIVVHPTGPHRYDTLINALHLRYRNLEDPETDIIPKLSHRIDRETSGVLVACKTRRHDSGVPLVFENADVTKEYLAIAEGVIESDAGVMDFPLGPAPDHKGPGPTPRAVRPDGAAARTGCRVQERFAAFTLVELRLFTGRQHQIRVHLQAIGHSVVCDSMYGVRSRLRLSDVRPLLTGEPDNVLLERQALHAWRIAFPHPATGDKVSVEAPLPEDMKRALEAMRGS